MRADSGTEGDAECGLSLTSQWVTALLVAECAWQVECEEWADLDCVLWVFHTLARGLEFICI